MRYDQSRIFWVLFKLLKLKIQELCQLLLIVNTIQIQVSKLKLPALLVLTKIKKIITKGLIRKNLHFPRLRIFCLFKEIFKHTVKYHFKTLDMNRYLSMKQMWCLLLSLHFKASGGERVTNWQSIWQISRLCWIFLLELSGAEANKAKAITSNSTWDTFKALGSN